MRTTVTDMLGIEFPILAFTHCRDVVAAVTKAGGLGVLGAVAHTPEQLEIDLAWIEAEIGDRPYGVDLIVPAKYAGDEGGGYTLDDIVAADPRRAPGVRRRHPRAATTCPSCPPTTTSRLGRPLDRGQRRRRAVLGQRGRPAARDRARPPHGVRRQRARPAAAVMIDRVKEEGRLVGALAGKAAARRAPRAGRRRHHHRPGLRGRRATPARSARWC